MELRAPRSGGATFGSVLETVLRAVSIRRRRTLGTCSSTFAESGFSILRQCRHSGKKDWQWLEAPIGGIFSRTRALWGARIESLLRRARGKRAAQPQPFPTCARQDEQVAQNGTPERL